MKDVVKFLGVDFELVDGKLKTGVLSSEKKNFHCNQNSANDFIGFVCGQMALNGFNICAKDIVFDGDKYKFNICEV